ncbi:Zn-ribbon domain-containing OB-fold protein [Rhodococcus sp. NPDC127528]|uniref:Zn-ribbon domain-containing OB-fold protein n=1 Tax=unclassified Rhodococcus (in: high G+C Gram-positive bacteria) TaxID=192944 RepID=UPI00362E1587
MHPNTLESPPTTSDTARPRAVASDALLLKRCAHCATLLAPTTAACTSCRGSELGTVPSSGSGAIVSWMPAPPAPDDPQSGPTPPAVAIVALDDGPRIYSWVEGEVTAVPDRAVRVEFRPSRPGERFPVFAVVPAAAEPVTSLTAVVA